MPDLRAGLARTRITPPPRSLLIGYGDRLRGRRGVHDDLTATALVLEDAGSRCALLALDLLCLHPDVVARVRQGVADAIGLPGDALLVACSHTHAGPIAWAGKGSPPWRRRLIDRLVAKLVGLVGQAASNPEPVGLAVGQGQARVAVNRRERRLDGSVALGVNPDGFVDPALGVAQLTDASGAPRATLVNFACHPAVLSPRNREVSAEWPGVMRREIEARTGATCLFLQGGAGDLNPDHEWGDDDWLMMDRIGTAVADAAIAVVENGLEPVSGAPIATSRSTLRIPVDLRRDAEGRVESYAATVSRLLRVPRPAVGLLLRYAYPWRPQLDTEDVARPSLPMEVQGIRIGDLAIVAHAAETFSEIAHAIRAGSPAPHTFFAGYSNGMIGYLPTAEASAAGGYEVEYAPLAYRVGGTFDAKAGDHAIARSLELVSRLYPDPAPSRPAG